MKKGTGIGIGIAVIVAAIIFGIASLPDEVLIESPSIDTSKNPQGEENQITIPPESISSNEQTGLKEETPVEPVKPTETKEEIPIEPAEQTPTENATQGKVIEIKIKDGVGSRDK